MNATATAIRIRAEAKGRARAARKAMTEFPPKLYAIALAMHRAYGEDALAHIETDVGVGLPAKAVAAMLRMLHRGEARKRIKTHGQT